MKRKVLLFGILLGTLNFLSTALRGDWTPSNGPWSGTVMDLLANGSNLFAATRGGGVFRSTDGGGTWNSANNGLTNLYVNTLL